MIVEKNLPGCLKGSIPLKSGWLPGPIAWLKLLILSVLQYLYKGYIYILI